MNRRRLRTFSIAREAEAVRDSPFGRISPGTLCISCRLGAEGCSAAGNSPASLAFTATCLLLQCFPLIMRISSPGHPRKDQTPVVILIRVSVQTASEWALRHAGLTRVRLCYPLLVSLALLAEIR